MKYTILAAVVLGAGVAAAPAPTFEFDHTHAAWTKVLESVLDDDGLVDYRSLRKNSKALDAYLADLEDTTPAEHAKWSRDERFAFWINAYNAYTIKLIVEEGPVDSIKDLGGWFSSPWEKKFIPLNAFDPEGDGKKITLDEIEHELIRPVFKDARVHAAVNCASMSCPPLRAEAYSAEKLDEQLDDQVKVWLRDTSRNKVAPKGGDIRVSKIFDWYEDDFGGNDEGVVRWIAEHVADEALATRLKAGAGDIDVRYLSYDWDLNAKKGSR